MHREIYTVFMNHGGPEHIGYIPMNLQQFANASDPAVKQLHDSYSHGGGWSPIEGWTFHEPNCSITYPDDPPLLPRAQIHIGRPNERVYIYDHAWVAVVGSDGTLQVARMD